MSESNKKNDPVVVTCYGNTETWESRAEAMAASEGSECEILCCLQMMQR